MDFPKRKLAKFLVFSKTSMSKYVQEYKQHGETSFNYKKKGVKQRTGTLITEAQEASLNSGYSPHTPDEPGINHCLT